jgi:hypothetical protein
MDHHVEGEFDTAHTEGNRARDASHLGWVFAGLGMSMIFGAGVIR